MRTRSLIGFGAATALAALVLAGCSGDASATTEADSSAPLTFAMPPGTDDPDTLLQVDVVAELIAEVSEREVAVENPADYMAVVEAVRSGFVDVALMSQFSTALAYANGSVEPLIVWETEQLPAALCVVRTDSDIQTLDDFRDGQIAFVDPGSTTGHFMPKSLLAQNDLTDGEDYTSTFAGSHDAAILAMLNGSVDMACTARQLLPIFVEQGLIAEDQFRVIAETDPIPIGISIVASSELDQETRDKITSGLPELLMADEGLTSLFGGSTDYIIEPDPSVYAPLLQVAEDAGVSLEDMR